MIKFEYPEDRKYFKKLLLTKGKPTLENFKTLFDFRPPEIKRREFNHCRKDILINLIKKHGNECMLAMECCDLDSGIVIDHLIPLSTNKLNKELRDLKPDKQNKVRSQSFGSNHLDNLIIACNNCNSYKKHRLLDRDKMLKILVEKEKKKLISKNKMLAFVNSLDWTFAKTYADICPHEYIVKNKLDPGLQATFEKVVSFIREAGFEACYKGHPGKYYILDSHYYWTMGEPIGQTTIINRAKLFDYSLVENSWVWKGK